MPSRQYYLGHCYTRNDWPVGRIYGAMDNFNCYNRAFAPCNDSVEFNPFISAAYNPFVYYPAGAEQTVVQRSHAQTMLWPQLSRYSGQQDNFVNATNVWYPTTEPGVKLQGTDSLFYDPVNKTKIPRDYVHKMSNNTSILGRVGDLYVVLTPTKYSCNEGCAIALNKTSKCVPSLGPALANCNLMKYMLGIPEDWPYGCRELTWWSSTAPLFIHWSENRVIFNMNGIVLSEGNYPYFSCDFKHHRDWLSRICPCV